MFALHNSIETKLYKLLRLKNPWNLYFLFVINSIFMRSWWVSQSLSLLNWGQTTFFRTFSFKCFIHFIIYIIYMLYHISLHCKIVKKLRFIKHEQLIQGWHTLFITHYMIPRQLTTFSSCTALPWIIKHVHRWDGRVNTCNQYLYGYANMQVFPRKIFRFSEIPSLIKLLPRFLMSIKASNHIQNSW